MRAAICRAYGPPEVVEVDDLPPPELGPGHVRVRVDAAAVNFPDVLLVANEYQIHVPPPFVPGSEFAGVVTELAAGIDTVAVGDRVTGTGLLGAFAEEAVVAAGAVTPIPSGIDERLAAAFGVAHRTAYHVLRSVAALHPGDVPDLPLDHRRGRLRERRLHLDEQPAVRLGGREIERTAAPLDLHGLHRPGGNVGGQLRKQIAKRCPDHRLCGP